MKHKKLEQFLGSLPNDSFVVGFLIHDHEKFQVEWMGPLAKYLSKMGYITVALCTPENNKNIEFTTADFFSWIAIEDIKNLDRINVFIALDYDTWIPFPQNSKVLACAHAVNFCEYVSSHNLYRTLHADGLVVSGYIVDDARKNISELFTGFFNPQFLQRKHNNLHLIPAGYPRYAVLSEELRANPRPLDAILYAPRKISTRQDLGGERIKKYGLELIETLLNVFNDKNVIFRPFRTDIDTSTIKNIRDYFKNENRFLIDDNLSTFDSFSRSHALITDNSLIACSFYFTTSRPGIFYQKWENKFPFFPGCYIMENLDEILDILDTTIYHPEIIKSKLYTKHNKFIIPCENIFENFSNILHDFYYDNKQQDWLTIERRNNYLLKNDCEIIDIILKQRDKAFLPFWALMFSNPRSTLLAAYALHFGFQSRACETNNLAEIKTIIKDIHGIELNGKTYGEIDPNIIKNFYSKSLYEKIVSNDQKGQTLVKSLLKNFIDFL